MLNVHFPNCFLHKCLQNFISCQFTEQHSLRIRRSYYSTKNWYVLKEGGSHRQIHAPKLRIHTTHIQTLRNKHKCVCLRLIWNRPSRRYTKSGVQRKWKNISVLVAQSKTSQPFRIFCWRIKKKFRSHIEHIFVLEKYTITERFHWNFREKC